MAILRLSARVMVMVCLPPGVNGANHRCMSSLINEKKIIVFKVMLNGTIRNNDQFGGFSHCLNFDKFRYTAPLR